MAKLTPKQIDFLKKNGMWNAGKDKSDLNLIKEGQFKDFDRRKEKLLAELARLPDDQRKPFETKLQAADGKAKKKDFKDAYSDLKEVKRDARRAANGYVDSLSLQDAEKELVFLSSEAKNIVARRQQLKAGQDNVLKLLAKEPKAASFNTLTEASAFRRDFKDTEVLLRGQVTGLTNTCAEITGYFRGAGIAKRFEEINFNLDRLQKEKGLDVAALKARSTQELAKFQDQGKLVTAKDVETAFGAYTADFNARINDHKDLGKFQQRDPGAEKISDETVRRPGKVAPEEIKKVDQSISAMLREIVVGGPTEGAFDTVLSELKAVEAQLAKQGNSDEVKKQMAVRKKRAVDALNLLDKRDAMRFRDAELGFLVDSMVDDGTVTKTQEKPKRVQPLATYDPESLVSELVLPANLKKAKPNEIQNVRQQVKAKTELLLDVELLKPDSDLVFDLGLKTKQDFIAQLAGEMQIDLKSKNCSDAEKQLLAQMAEQMVASVQAKFPNKATAASKIPAKDGKQVDAPGEFVLGGKKFKNPKYLASGGLGHIVRYEEDGTNPPQYTVLKSLINTEKRDEMIHELKMHRQAQGGETGQGSPNVVGMKGAVQGPDGGLYMAVEYADGGDLDGVGLGMAQASQGGVLSEEARQVLCQHLLRQAMSGMKHVQDSNMTHHDIKEMNYLIGGDGTVKVADFGSAQFADDKGEVEKGNYLTTPGYEAPELYGRGGPAVTGKADTYSLGVMLNNLNSPAGGWDKRNEDKKSEQAVTALDRLKNAMLDDDPNKRPTLEAVMQTAYMSDSTANYEPGKVDNLMKALLAYNKNVASKTESDMRNIVGTQGEIVSLERKKQKVQGEAAALKAKQGATPKDIDDLNKKNSEIESIDASVAKDREEIKKYQQNIDKILAQSDIKPHVEALAKANRELTGRGAQGEQIDVSKLKFKDEFEKIVLTSGFPADSKPLQVLLRNLIVVDQAGDPATKKKLAATAEAEAKRLAQQLSDVAKLATTPDKTKMQLSKLGVDLRKLEQALKTFNPDPAKVAAT